MTMNVAKLTAGLSRIWAGHPRDWDRDLWAGNYPETTRYNYLLASSQLARYLAEQSPDPDADAAAGDPTAVTRAHVEALQGSRQCPAPREFPFNNTVLTSNHWIRRQSRSSSDRSTRRERQ
jgi:hypothetical protein